MVQKLLQSLYDEVRLSSSQMTVVDKITPYPNTSATVVSKISKMFPTSKIIHLIRDPRDQLISAVFLWLNKDALSGSHSRLVDNDYHTSRYMWITEGKTWDDYSNFLTNDEITLWVRDHWLDVHRSMEVHSTSPNYCCLRYENFVTDFSSETQRLFSFLDRPLLQKEMDRIKTNTSFARMSGRRSHNEESPFAHVRKGLIGEWRSYLTREQGKLIHSILGDILLRLGYETDNSWYQALPESRPLSDLPVTASVRHTRR